MEFYGNENIIDAKWRSVSHAPKMGQLVMMIVIVLIHFESRRYSLYWSSRKYNEILEFL